MALSAADIIGNRILDHVGAVPITVAERMYEVIRSVLAVRAVAEPRRLEMGSVRGLDYRVDRDGSRSGRPGVYVRFKTSRDVVEPFKIVDPGKSHWFFYKDSQSMWWGGTRALELLLADIELDGDAARLLTSEARDVLSDLAEIRFANVPAHGTEPEGTFQLLPSGYVRLELKRKWQPKSPVAGIVALRVEGDGASKKWYQLFKASRATNLVAPDLAKAGFPVIAKQLAETYANVAEPYSGIGECDPLRDMADAPEPADVKHPIGKAVLADVAEAMRTRAPAKLALYPYQTVGVGFLKLLGYRGILADDMGLGKTPTALGTIVVDPQDLLPAVVVAPAIVFTNWADEAKRWLPAVPIWPMVERSAPPPPKGFKGIIITKYSTIPWQIDAIMHAEPKYMIVDEAHRIKNPQAQQTQAVTSLAEKIPHVVLLSGTPIKNNVVELWNLLNTVDPEDYGRKGDFEDEYAITEDVNIGRGRTRQKIVGAKNTELLQHRLKCLMIRRLKSQVAKFLPDKTRQYITVDVEPKVMKEYVKAEKDFANWVDTEIKRRIAEAIKEAKADGQTLSKSEQEDVIADAREAVARAVANEALVKVGYLRRLAGKMKIPAVVELIAEFIENEAPLIVFAVHKDVISGIADALEKGGVRFAVIDGSVPAGDRGDIVKSFQAGQLDVIIGSEAMKEGVTLTRASNVLFAERFWTSADEEQAEDRAHRVGQKNAVTILFPEARDTIDERMRGIIDIKRKLIASTVGGAKVAEGGGTLAALLGTFGKGKSAVTMARANPKARKSKSLYVDDVGALVFGSSWTEGSARQWAAVNGFQGKLSQLDGRVVMRIRQLAGRTKTVRVAEGVTAIVVA
jgi:SWI/SNF-related matrix-associated actin-dependent regulator 1 of chromatin subfamily A